MIYVCLCAWSHFSALWCFGITHHTCVFFKIWASQPMRDQVMLPEKEGSAELAVLDAADETEIRSGGFLDGWQIGESDRLMGVRSLPKTGA